MDEIGLFEAKTKFSEICEQVSTRREGVVVTRRGTPLVRIEPILAREGKPQSVWDRRAEFEKKNGPFVEDFTLVSREKQLWKNPLDE